MIGLRRGSHVGFGTRVNSIRARFSSVSENLGASDFGSDLLYRDVFVLDNSWSEDTWKTSLESLHKEGKSGILLKHPKCSHVIAKYVI